MAIKPTYLGTRTRRNLAENAMTLQGKNICTEEKMKKQVAETAVCEKGRGRDGRETVNISSFLLQTKWNPPLIGLAEVTVCVCQCVFVGKYLYTSV